MVASGTEAHPTIHRPALSGRQAKDGRVGAQTVHIFPRRLSPQVHHDNPPNVATRSSNDPPRRHRQSGRRSENSGGWTVGVRSAGGRCWAVRHRPSAREVAARDRAGRHASPAGESASCRIIPLVSQARERLCSAVPLLAIADPDRYPGVMNILNSGSPDALGSRGNVQATKTRTTS